MHLEERHSCLLAATVAVFPLSTMAVRKQLAAAFRAKRSQFDFWLQLSVFALLGLALWPVTGWLAQTTLDQSRLLHALIVLLFAGTLLVADRQPPVENALTMGTVARLAVAASYSLLLLGFVLHAMYPGTGPLLGPVLLLIAYCAGLGAFFVFVFGKTTARISFTLCATFCAFVILSLFMAPLDWPLRSLAGKWSGIVLSWLGKSIELGLVDAAGMPPKLILLADRHPFHVASECNGFGVIFTCFLVALLLSIYRRASSLDGALNLAAGLMLGFAFNIIRIVVIVLLAPALMEHYLLMHEIVGAITYWGCLVLLWLLLKGPTTAGRRRATPPDTATARE